MLILLAVLIAAQPQTRPAPPAPPPLFAGQIAQADFDALRRCHGALVGQRLAVEALMPRVSDQAPLRRNLEQTATLDADYKRLWAGAEHPDFGLDEASGDRAYRQGLAPWEAQVARNNLAQLLPYWEANKGYAVGSVCRAAANKVKSGVDFRAQMTDPNYWRRRNN